MTARQHHTLKEQLEAEIADSEHKEAMDRGFHNGDDWWQLNDAEEMVFDIERDRFPRMMMTWHCYEGFKLLTDSTLWDEALIAHARHEFPQWHAEADGPPTLSEKEFGEFAKEFGRLSAKEATSIYYKHWFWQVRCGIVRYLD
jgi:hypothetical protein